MGYGKAEKACSTFKHWLANPGLCGICAWPEREHQKERKMQPHQERVVAELKELTEKRRKLGLFIADNAMFGALPREERVRLRRQFDIMIQYEGVLQERIDHFPK
jgi:radical SAM superfamily enzyme YgiQ (UPF0313 family)